MLWGMAWLTALDSPLLPALRSSKDSELPGVMWMGVMTATGLTPLGAARHGDARAAWFPSTPPSPGSLQLPKLAGGEARYSLKSLAQKPSRTSLVVPASWSSQSLQLARGTAVREGIRAFLVHN